MAVEATPVLSGNHLGRRGSHRRTSGQIRAILPLARAEGRRLIRHPVVVGGSLLSLVVFVLVTWNQAPVLQRDGIWAAGSVLALAAATFLSTNLAASRSRRHRTDELFEPAVVGVADRTLAHLLSAAWPAGLAMVLIGIEMVYLATRRPVGSPDVLELMVGPAVVVFAGILGVAIARWSGFAGAGPIALVALGSLQAYLLFHLPGGSYHQGRSRWLAPWVPLAASGNPPREIVIRPTWAHLLYLVAAASAIGAIALLRHGVTRRRAVLLAVALGVTLLAAAVQTRPPTLNQQLPLVDLAARPERHQVCETDGLSRICVYPGYKGWMDRWARIVRATLEPIPPAARPVPLEIRQTLSNPWAADLPRDAGQRLEDQRSGIAAQGANRIQLGTEWGDGSRAGRDELALGLLIAGRAVGLPGSPGEMVITRNDIDRLVRQAAPEERARYRRELVAHPEYVGSCTSEGQARAVVAMWLAGQISPGATTALQRIVSQDQSGLQIYRSAGQSASIGYGGPGVQDLQSLGYDIGTGSPVLWTKAEATYAVQLLGRERLSVRMALRQHWQEVVDPSTPASRLVELFRLRSSPTLEEQLRQAGLGPEQAREIRRDYGYQIPCR